MSFVDSFEQSNKRRAERRLRWKNHGINVVSVILSVALTFLAAFRFPGAWLWIWFFLLALVIIGTFIKEIVTFRNDRDFAALVRECQGLRDYKRTTTQAVTELLEDLGRRSCEALNINNEHTRITFYGHSTKGFVPLARYSMNPSIMRIGRTLYPEEQGIIWDTWTNAKANFTARGAKTEQDLIAMHVNTGVPEQVVKEFNMIPRYMIGIRLDQDSTRLGVVIVESQKQLNRGLTTQLTASGLLNPVLPVLRTLEPVFEEISN